MSPQSFPPVTGGKAATAGIKQVANPKGKSRVYFTQLKIAIICLLRQQGCRGAGEIGEIGERNLLLFLYFPSMQVKRATAYYYDRTHAPDRGNCCREKFSCITLSLTPSKSPPTHPQIETAQPTRYQNNP